MRTTYRITDRSGTIRNIYGISNGGKNICLPVRVKDRTTGADVSENFGQIHPYSVPENYRMAPEGSGIVAELQKLETEYVNIDAQIEALKDRKREISAEQFRLVNLLPEISADVPRLGTVLSRQATKTYRTNADRLVALPKGDRE
jgi:hypothetical protein